MSRKDELRELGERLIMLATADSDDEAAQPTRQIALFDPHDEYDETILVQIARALYRLRRERERLLPAELFAEPAWDMLLDLYIQRSIGRRVTVTSLCIASGVATTTALRWVGLLIESGLAKRVESEEDRRKAFVVLSDRGYRAVRSILIDASRSFLPRGAPFMLSRVPMR